VEASTEHEIDAAFETLARQQAGGLVVWQEAFLATQRDRILKLAQHHGVPVISGFRSFTEAGGLMSYATPWTESYRQVGIAAGCGEFAILEHGGKPVADR
jgi:putative ABC transport system substrate-binding protein